ncbi:hypothetical protein WJX73_008901 [Symbiochloris irregularis]|uniref:Uncharacterized protein n=1 Tax=Symbiochloris irregularis TaxID=706552 RepID=A0AAW1NLG3_9CHLO
MDQIVSKRAAGHTLCVACDRQGQECRNNLHLDRMGDPALHFVSLEEALAIACDCVLVIHVHTEAHEWAQEHDKLAVSYLWLCAYQLGLQPLDFSEPLYSPFPSAPTASAAGAQATVVGFESPLRRVLLQILHDLGLFASTDMDGRTVKYVIAADVHSNSRKIKLLYQYQEVGEANKVVNILWPVACTCQGALLDTSGRYAQNVIDSELPHVLKALLAVSTGANILFRPGGQVAPTQTSQQGMRASLPGPAARQSSPGPTTTPLNTTRVLGTETQELIDGLSDTPVWSPSQDDEHAQAVVVLEQRLDAARQAQQAEAIRAESRLAAALEVAQASSAARLAAAERAHASVVAGHAAELASVKAKEPAVQSAQQQMTAVQAQVSALAERQSGLERAIPVLKGCYDAVELEKRTLPTFVKVMEQVEAEEPLLNKMAELEESMASATASLDTTSSWLGQALDQSRHLQTIVFGPSGDDADCDDHTMASADANSHPGTDEAVPVGTRSQDLARPSSDPASLESLQHQCNTHTCPSLPALRAQLQALLQRHAQALAASQHELQAVRETGRSWEVACIAAQGRLSQIVGTALPPISDADALALSVEATARHVQASLEAVEHEATSTRHVQAILDGRLQEMTKLQQQISALTESQKQLRSSSSSLLQQERTGGLELQKEDQLPVINELRGALDIKTAQHALTLQVVTESNEVVCEIYDKLRDMLAQNTSLKVQLDREQADFAGALLTVAQHAAEIMWLQGQLWAARSDGAAAIQALQVERDNALRDSQTTKAALERANTEASALKSQRAADHAAASAAQTGLQQQITALQKWEEGQAVVHRQKMMRVWTWLQRQVQGQAVVHRQKLMRMWTWLQRQVQGQLQRQLQKLIWRLDKLPPHTADKGSCFLTYLAFRVAK